MQRGHDITQLHFELFADDLLVILKDYRQTKMLMETMKEAYADLELEINDAKTKIMLIGKQNPHIKSVMQKRLVDDIQLVKEFRYLGLIINNLGRAHKDVQKKRQKAETITKSLCKWRNENLGFLSCLGLWQIFIR